MKALKQHWIILVYLIFLSSCKTYYLNDNQPIWKNNNLSIHTLKSDKIKVISYNIQESKNIDQAISELKTEPSLKNGDIILLQEMNETGVHSIAKALNHNFVYFPISYYKASKRNVGNAILSKYSIETPQKVILPNKKFLDRGRRMSCSANIIIGTSLVNINSIHLETIAMSRKKRVEQLEKIIETTISDSNHHFVIGGDFNSMFHKDKNTMITRLENAGFNWCSPNIGATGQVPLNVIKPQLDHIFSKGFDLIDFGKCETCKASDHKPIWAYLKLDN